MFQNVLAWADFPLKGSGADPRILSLGWVPGVVLEAMVMFLCAEVQLGVVGLSRGVKVLWGVTGLRVTGIGNPGAVLGLPGILRIVARVWNCLWGVGVTGSGQWPLVALGGLVGRSGVSGGSLNSDKATSSSLKLTGQLFMYSQVFLSLLQWTCQFLYVAKPVYVSNTSMYWIPGCFSQYFSGVSASWLSP